MKALKQTVRKYYKYVDNAFVQPTLSSNGTLGGNSFAVEQSSTYSSYYAYKMFDNNSSTTAVADYNSAYFTFYNPKPLNVTAITIKNDSDSLRAIQTCKVSVSNDNTTYTDIYTYTDGSSPYETWTIDLSSNTGYYKYYKVTVLSTGGHPYEIIQTNITATYRTIEEGTSSDYDFYIDSETYKANYKTLSTALSVATSNPNLILQDNYHGTKNEVGIETEVLTYSAVNQDMTPTPQVDNTNNGSWGSNFGDSQNYWWWGNEGYVFGATLGSGFHGYSHHSPSPYDIGPQGDNRGYNGNYITHTFETPLIAGAYKFQCASNGYGYILQAQYDGDWHNITLPENLSTTEWKYTSEFNVTISLTAIRACSTGSTGDWGIGAIHLLQVGAWKNGSNKIVTLSDYDLELLGGQPQTDDTITLTYTTTQTLSGEKKFRCIKE